VPATNQDSLVVFILKNLINNLNRVTNSFKVKNRFTLKFFLNKNNSSRKGKPFEKRCYPKEFINETFQDGYYQSIFICSWQIR